MTPPVLKRYTGTVDQETGNLRFKDKTSGHDEKCLIQSGRTSNTSTGTISFDTAYSDTPRVIIACESNANNGIAWPQNVTTTGFQTVNKKDGGMGSAFTGIIQWIAIGRGE